MRTTGVSLASGLLAIVAIGCSADAGATVPSSSVAPNDIPPCTEVYTEGMEITRADFGQACTTESGTLVTPRPIRIECEDDRQLLWNDFGWGFIGEPMTVTPEEAVSKMPTEALADCLAGPNSSAQDRTTTTE
jgi:hypothetical protein